MSWKALSWAEDVGEQLELPANQRWVLHLLANLADEEWSCWPSQEFLRRKSGLSLRTVRDCLKKLENQGLFEVEDRRNAHGGRLGHRYYLQKEALQESASFPGMAVPADSAGRAPVAVENLPANPAGRPQMPANPVPANPAGRGSYRQMTTSLPATAAGPAREVDARASLPINENHHSSSNSSGEFRPRFVEQNEEPAGGAAGEEEREGIRDDQLVGSSAFGLDPQQSSSRPSAGEVPVGDVLASGISAAHRGVDLTKMQAQLVKATGRRESLAMVRALVDLILDRATSTVGRPQGYVGSAISNNPDRTGQDLDSLAAATAAAPAAGAVSAPSAGPVHCPIPEHADSGYRKSNCPRCRKWAEFPERLAREVFEQLDADVQQLAIKAGVQINGGGAGPELKAG